MIYCEVMCYHMYNFCHCWERCVHMRNSHRITICILTGCLLAVIPSTASAYELIGGRFTQDPLNVFYYNSAGTAVRTVESGTTYYYSHWLEVGHAVQSWNNTQNTKIYFISTSDKSKSIMDIENTPFFNDELFGQTSMWNGNTQLTVEQTKSTWWYWAKIEMNSSPSCIWRSNWVTQTSSNQVAVGKLEHTAAHEIGHALGLNHLGEWGWNTEKLMYPNPYNYYKYGIKAPTSDEVEAVQKIYGKLY